VRCIGCAALRAHYFQSLRLPRRRLLLLLLSTDASSASTAVPMLLAVAAAATGFLSCCARLLLLLLTATLGAVTPNIARATLTADGIFFVRWCCSMRSAKSATLPPTSTNIVRHLSSLDTSACRRACRA
jgi:hypothetical protein